MPADAATKSDDAAAASASPSSQNAASPGVKRKRGAAASSRGVANLTPDQLERKRANDREAQRAIRERTKSQIDRLNTRILELESSQPYLELQNAVRLKDAVVQENEEMKRQLASFVGIFQRFVGGSAQGLEELAAAAEQNAVPYPQDQHQSQPYPPPAILDTSSPHATGSGASPPNQGQQQHQYSYTGPVDASHVRGAWPPQNAPYDPNPRNNRNIQPDLASYNPSSDERLNVDFLLDSNQRIAKMTNGQQSNMPQSTPLAGPHSVLPRLGDATCPLDALMLDFLAERQRMAAQGANSETLVGPKYPNFNALLDRGTLHYSHPLSKVFTDILRTFPDLSNLPEQVAVVHIMFLVMRWCCEPTKENYEMMPEWARPRPISLFTKHPCWLDYLPWPKLRDLTMQCDPPPPFDSFFVPYTTTLSLNWPYNPRDVLLPSRSPGGGKTGSNVAARGVNGSALSPKDLVDEPIWTINPAFETHILDLQNWSLGPAFAEHFPDWADAVRVSRRSGPGPGPVYI